MIEYEYDDRDEILRPRHVAKKPRTKKTDHKHIYELKFLESSFRVHQSSSRIATEICKICGREGKIKIVRGENNE